MANLHFKCGKERIGGVKEADKIANRFDWLINGVRIITLMQRKKEGGPTKTDRAAKKFISLGEDQFVDVLQKALDQWTPDYRIYCTVNSRDMEKGLRNFKQAMLDNDYQDNENKYYFYTDIWNRLISALQKPSARFQKLFLIDIDNDDKNGLDYKSVLLRLKELEIFIYADYQTKNGRHIITEPFEYPKLIPELKKLDNVKTDGMALLKY